MKYLYIFVLSFFTLSAFGQCPDEATLESTGTKTVPTDGTCDSPADDGLVCNFSTTDFLDMDGNLTVLSCATLNLSTSNAIYSFGSITIEEGGTLTTNRTLRVTGTLTVNGSLIVGDGAGGDNLRIVSGGSVTVGTNGSVDVTNGFIRVGSNGGNNGTLDIDGTVSASGDIDLNGGGEISGDGQLSWEGTFDDGGGTLSGTFGSTGCSGSNSSCGDTSLPVELVAFENSVSRNGNMLRWITASELNNEGFYVEYSSDGSDFQSLGYVEGNGTTSVENHYEYRIRSQFFDAYYRLKQVDYDRAFEYSQIIFVPGANQEALQIVAFPNPVVDHVNLRSNSGRLFHASIIDMSGQELYRTDGQPVAVSAIEEKINDLLPLMQAGTYLVHFTSMESSFTIRLLRR